MPRPSLNWWVGGNASKDIDAKVFSLYPAAEHTTVVHMFYVNNTTI